VGVYKVYIKPNKRYWSPLEVTAGEILP
jgi:hypothetical protein